MASTSDVLKTEAGVVLTEVKLMRGSVVVATGYTVSSRRTPEVRHSHTRETAERHYAEELARCERPRG